MKMMLSTPSTISSTVSVMRAIQPSGELIQSNTYDNSSTGPRAGTSNYGVQALDEVRTRRGDRPGSRGTPRARAAPPVQSKVVAEICEGSDPGQTPELENRRDPAVYGLVTIVA